MSPDTTPPVSFLRMRSVVVRAPTRLDFGGGWTDVPPFTTDEGGRVCNLAIDRYAEVQLHAHHATGSGDVSIAADGTLAHAALTRAALTGVRSSIRSDFPTGAGLGGSSAVGIALTAAIRAWRGQSLDDRMAMVEESRAIEVEDAGIAGGWQDHFAAAWGGALDLVLADTNTVRPIPLADATREAIERRCLVFYTGQSRLSGDTITAVLDAYAAGDAHVVAALRAMKALAGDMAGSLASGDLDALGTELAEHWVHQRALHPAIPTPRIDEVIAEGTRAGAIGGKALGASGGGCVLLLAREGAEDAIRDAVEPLARAMGFRIDLRGVHLVAAEPEGTDG